MNTSRILGGLLCVASVVVAILHVSVGYLELFDAPRIPLAFALPVTVMVLVATGLGAWLGWIMATTKEAAPAPSPAVEESEEEPEEEESS